MGRSKNLKEYEDWSGEVHQEQSAAWQLDTIDDLLLFANLDQKEKDLIYATRFQLTYNEADETIAHLRENQVEQKPRKIWEQRIKNKN